jgi:hypothetical protein
MTTQQMKYFMTLAYLYFFPGSEGVGGKRRVLETDDFYPGTRLRQPNMSLYETPKSERDNHLGKLVHLGLLEVTGESEGLTLYKATQKGIDLLKSRKEMLVTYTHFYKYPGGATLETKCWTFCTTEHFKRWMKAYNVPGSNRGVGNPKFYKMEEDE